MLNQDMALWICLFPWPLKYPLGSIPSQCNKTWLKKPSVLKNMVRLDNRGEGKAVWVDEEESTAMWLCSSDLLPWENSRLRSVHTSVMGWGFCNRIGYKGKAVV